MFISASLFVGTSFTVAVFTIFATSNVDLIVGISHKNIFDEKNFNPHKKPISLLNVPICTQGMQQTWWPEAGTIIVTGPYWSWKVWSWSYNYIWNDKTSWDACQTMTIVKTRWGFDTNNYSYLIMFKVISYWHDDVIKWTQRPETRSFEVFFDLHRNKRLSKQWWGWWFEMPSCSLCRHCNGCPENAFCGQNKAVCLHYIWISYRWN